MSRCAQICAITLAVLGIVLLIVAIAGRNPLSRYIDTQIKQRVLITPSTRTYESWRESPVPIYDYLFLFNITNPIDFNRGEKAVLDVVGPFVYRKKQIKKDANFTGNLEFAMYYDYVRYIFDQSETQKHNKRTSLDDTIFIPNIPLITVVSQLSHNSKILPFFKLELEDLVEKYEAFEGVDYLTLNGTIEDILWGMDDPIMELLFKFKMSPSPKLALQTNGSTDPGAMTLPTVVFTGHTDISKIDEYHAFHGRNSSGCWGSEAANRINGTEGSVFEPLLVYNKSRSVSIYNEQLYRSVDLNYVRDSEYNGIKCYVYKIPDWALESEQNNPVNKAYYAYTYSGMLNLTKCLSSVPLYVTKAMFLDADVRLMQNITLSEKANRTLHETYLCIEPYTGIVVDGHKRVQINVQIEHQSSVGILNNTKPAFIPLIYVDEHGSITPDLASQLKNHLLLPIQITHVAFYVLCALGVAVFLCSVLLHVQIVRNKYIVPGQVDNERRRTSVQSEEQILISPEEPDRSETSDQYLSFDGKTSQYYEASG